MPRSVSIKEIKNLDSKRAFRRAYYYRNREEILKKDRIRAKDYYQKYKRQILLKRAGRLRQKIATDPATREKINSIRRMKYKMLPLAKKNEMAKKNLEAVRRYQEKNRLLIAERARRKYHADINAMRSYRRSWYQKNRVRWNKYRKQLRMARRDAIAKEALACSGEEAGK